MGEYSLILQCQNKLLPAIQAGIRQYKLTHSDITNGHEFEFTHLDQLFQVALVLDNAPC